MKTLRNILILFLAVTNYSATAQTKVADLDDYDDKSEMVHDLMTHQYDEFEKVEDDEKYAYSNEFVAELNKSKSKSRKDHESKMKSEEERKLCEVEEYVYIDNYGYAKLSHDLLTSTVDYNMRYVSCREKDSILDAKLEKEAVADIQGPRNENKVLARLEVEDLQSNVIDQLIITDNGEYLYRDGEKLEGNEEIKEELSDGKPITELTFYYELIDAGIIQDTLSAKEFTDMTIKEQSILVSYYQ